MLIKPGVDLKGIKPEIVVAIQVAWSIYYRHAEELMITSGIEGQHMEGSLHYKGLAVDIRLPNNKFIVVSDLRNALGSQYDIVLEKDHIHIEFDPKNT